MMGFHLDLGPEFELLAKDIENHLYRRFRFEHERTACCLVSAETYKNIFKDEIWHRLIFQYDPDINGRTILRERCFPSQKELAKAWAEVIELISTHGKASSTKRKADPNMLFKRRKLGVN